MKFIRTHKTLILILLIIIFSIFSTIVLKQNRVFTRRSVRQIQTIVKSYGNSSVVVLVTLILLSTLIPPLPLPIPLIEITSGLIYGIIPGIIISFFAQVLSSCIAFYLSRQIGRKYFRRFISNKVFQTYKQYIDNNGSKAVITLRATIASPFNMVSFLSGLTEMKFSSFLIATMIGILPEVIIFNLIGNSLQTIRIRLSVVFIGLILVSAVGMISSLWVIKRKR